MKTPRVIKPWMMWTSVIMLTVTILGTLAIIATGLYLTYGYSPGEKEKQEEIVKINEIETLLIEERVKNTELNKQINTLNANLKSAEDQLLVYEGAISCMTVEVYFQDAMYGGFRVGESEVCGYKIKMSEKAWGPSVEWFIAKLQRENEALKAELEKNKN